MLHVTGTQHHQAAAMCANWGLRQRDFAPAHHAHVNPIDQPVEIPDHDSESATRRDVRSDAETDGGDGERNHDLHALPLAVAESLAVAPRRQLDTRRFPDAHEVVAFPPNQGDLVGRCGDTSVARGASNRFDALEAIVERREIPAATARADDPEPALPFVEGDPPANAKTRRATITVKPSITECATAKHPRK